MFPLRDSHESHKFPIVTNAIILINVAVFVLEILAPDTDAFIQKYALVPALVDFSNLQTLIPFITSQFLHGGFVHILSNMWFLKIFGDNVEERFGSVIFLFIYLLSGLIGGLGQYIFSPASEIPMLGASGAVAGILGAYFVFFPHHTIETIIPLGLFITTANIPASVMLFYWFITQIFSGVGSVATTVMGGVAWWAHVGGFVTGWIIARISGGRRIEEAEEGEILDM